MRSLENEFIPESIHAETRELGSGRATEEMEPTPLFLAPEKFYRGHAW
jgi:hypothetical protein